MKELTSDIVLPHIYALAAGYMKNPKMFQVLARCAGPRKMMEWGYRIVVNRGRLSPIEKMQQEAKQELWDASAEYGSLPKIERLRWCRAVYFIMNVQEVVP